MGMDRVTWCRALARRLSEARERSGLTLAQAAERSGLRPNSIWRWESGATSPSAYDLARYCAAIGVQVGDVLPS